MKPIRLPWMNLDLVAPAGREDEVQTLPVHYDVASRTSTSVWTLDEQELASVMATKSIAIRVMGQHPPILPTPLTIEEPQEMRFAVTIDQQGAVQAKSISDVLCLVLHAFVNNHTTITVARE